MKQARHRVGHGAGGRGLLCEEFGDAQRKFWMKPLRETNVDIVQTLFDASKILLWNGQHFFLLFLWEQPQKIPWHLKIVGFHTLSETKICHDIPKGNNERGSLSSPRESLVPVVRLFSSPEPLSLLMGRPWLIKEWLWKHDLLRF